MCEHTVRDLPRISIHRYEPWRSEMSVGCRRVAVFVPFESDRPPFSRIVPWRLERFTLPPRIGKVTVVPDWVAGESAVTVMWLLASTVATVLDTVSFELPPVTFVEVAARATELSASARVAPSASTRRTRRIGLLSLHFRY